MSKIQTIHGSIASIIIYAQLKDGVPYIGHHIKEHSSSSDMIIDEMLDKSKALLFYVVFNNAKAFINQMEYNASSLLGLKMRELYKSLKIK